MSMRFVWGISGSPGSMPVVSACLVVLVVAPASRCSLTVSDQWIKGRSQRPTLACSTYIQVRYPSSECLSFIWHAMAGSPAVERDPYGGADLDAIRLAIRGFTYFLGETRSSLLALARRMMRVPSRMQRNLQRAGAFRGGRAKAGLEPGLFRGAGRSAKSWLSRRGGRLRHAPARFEPSSQPASIVAATLMYTSPAIGRVLRSRTSLPWNSRWLRVCEAATNIIIVRRGFITLPWPLKTENIQSKGG
ncbi:hypothetical protein J3F84DRAFT_231003 [Trichoderma pleuroticola]